MFAKAKVTVAAPFLMVFFVVFAILATAGWTLTRLSEVVIKFSHWVEYHAYKDLLSAKRGMVYLGNGKWSKGDD